MPLTLASLKTFPMRVTLQPDGLGEPPQWAIRSGRCKTGDRATMALTDVPQLILSQSHPMPRSSTKRCRHRTGKMTTRRWPNWHHRNRSVSKAAVLVVERWILARQRNRQFYSLAEVNAAIADLLRRLNEERRISSFYGHFSTT